MIVLDTSAIIAILQQESDAASLLEAIEASAQVVMGAPTKFEILLVASRRPTGQDDVRALIRSAEIEVLPWTDVLADIAAEAFLTFGKGRGHKAQLNFGDCMAYALAKSLDAPLLFKGGDFSKTDVKCAL